MRIFLPLIIFLVIHTSSLSQGLAVDSAATTAFKNVVSFYNNSFSKQLHLYNGREYKGYMKSLVGHPYFTTDSFTNGTVNYEGSVYENVSILYNLVNDELIIKENNFSSAIQLSKEKVFAFSVGEHSFINSAHDASITTKVSPAFYNVLANGKVGLLARRLKTIEETVQHIVVRRVIEKDHFYLTRNGAITMINSKNGFLQQLSDKRKDVQEFIKENKLNYRNDKESFLLKTIQYYNSLTN